MDVKQNSTPDLGPLPLESLNRFFSDDVDYGLDFDSWMRLMPSSMFMARQSWQKDDLLERFKEVLKYTRNYLDEQLYCDEEEDFVNRPEDKKCGFAGKAPHKFYVETYRDLMNLVPVFKQIPVENL